MEHCCFSFTAAVLTTVFMLILIKERETSFQQEEAKIFNFETVLPLEEGSWDKIEFCTIEATERSNTSVLLYGSRSKVMVLGKRERAWELKLRFNTYPDVFLSMFTTCIGEEFFLKSLMYVYHPESLVVVINKNNEEQIIDIDPLQKKVYRRLRKSGTKTRMRVKIAHQNTRHGSRV